MSDTELSQLRNDLNEQQREVAIARKDAALALQAIKMHEDRCDERQNNMVDAIKATTEALSGMGEKIEGSTRRVHDRIDRIGEETKNDSKAQRRWVLGIIGAILIFAAQEIIRAYFIT